jgi:hypothetical protein
MTESKNKINPEWVNAGPESDIHFVTCAGVVNFGPAPSNYGHLVGPRRFILPILHKRPAREQSGKKS